MGSVAATEITMTCEVCDVTCHRIGVHRNGLRRFRCPQCRKTYTEPHRLTLGEMCISEEKALLAMQLIVEGNSIRSTMRITGLDGNTITKALILAGERCEKVMGRLIVNVPVKDVECDEIWGYVRKKEAHKFPFEADDKNIGDAYCFVGIERHSKLVLNFALTSTVPLHSTPEVGLLASIGAGAGSCAGGAEGSGWTTGVVGCGVG